MSNTKVANIAKNTSYFTIALIIQKVISFGYFTLLASNLLPEDLGKYYFAISFTTIFSVFIDLGLANVLIREVAKDQGASKTIFSNILAIKIPLAIFTFITLSVGIYLLGYPELVRDLVYISSICMILDSFSLIFFSYIRGYHNLKFESIASIIFQLIVLIFGYTVLKAGWGLKWQMFALALASMFNVLFSALLVRFKWQTSLLPKFNWATTKLLLAISVPFAIFGILQRFYTYFDSVLLSFFSGDKYVGLYQISFKIINALQFLPLAFTASLYPAFSSYWKNNRDQLVITFERAMNYLIVISLPISIGVIALADKIVFIFKPEYGEAVLPLRINMIALLFLFATFPVGSILNACDLQKKNTANMGYTLALSVLLNIILIPFTQKQYANGAIGASLTVVATNIFMLVLGMRLVPRIAVYRLSNIVKTLLKALFASLLMAFLIFLSKDTINLFIVILFSGFTYFLALLLLGGFKKEDIFSVIASFKR